MLQENTHCVFLSHFFYWYEVQLLCLLCECAGVNISWTRNRPPGFKFQFEIAQMPFGNVWIQLFYLSYVSLIIILAHPLLRVLRLIMRSFTTTGRERIRLVKPWCTRQIALLNSAWKIYTIYGSCSMKTVAKSSFTLRNYHLYMDWKWWFSSHVE